MIHTDLTTPSDEHYQLARALLLYEQKRDYQHAPAFVSVHDIQRHERGAALAVGRLLSERELLELLTRLTGKGALRYLPPHVLAASSAGIAWFASAQQRPLFFNTSNFGASRADPYLDETISGHAYPVPALLFIAGSAGLRLYALDRDERPTPDTRLYRAPFYNLFSDGRVCSGSMPRPTGVTPERTSDYERAYFGSYFSHPNAAPLLNPSAWGGTYGEAWARARELERFPSEWLVEQGMTLAQALP